MKAHSMSARSICRRIITVLLLLMAAQLLPLLVEDGLHGLLGRLQGRLDGAGTEQNLLDALGEWVTDVTPSQHVRLAPGVLEALGNQADVRRRMEAVILLRVRLDHGRLDAQRGDHLLALAGGDEELEQLPGGARVLAALGDGEL